MSKRPWFPLYVGDMLADTMNFTPAQFGGYMKILCHYWVTEEPMTRDEMMVASGLSKNIFEKSWPVFVKKFVTENEKYFNRRMKDEITKAVEISDKRAKAGSKGGVANAQANDEQLPTQSQSQSQSHNNTIKKHISDSPESARFEEWWIAYDKKVDRKKCEAKWSKLNWSKLNITPDFLIADAQRRHRDCAKWAAGYQKNPLTYLNGECWNDELQQPTKQQLTPADEYEIRQRRTNQIVSELNGGVVEHDESALPPPMESH